jgi:2-polyprenyl-3-methyl-5-hydroxy-6-metoxy-1,4-benzoquinol methylase
MKPDLLREQIEYYRERASEYDQWFLRQGRYDRGEAHRQQWFSEVLEVEKALHAAKPSGDILELACGTGLWTQHLAPLANYLMAIDAAPEVILLNQQRVNSSVVEYIVADLFNWNPPQKFDFVFFGFWLSHVPMEKFTTFWEMVRKSLKPNGQVFFVDSLFNQESIATNHAPLHKQGYSERKLNDGRVYHVVKIFHEPTQLEQSLLNLGWTGSIHQTASDFIYGLVHPADET